MWHFRNTVKGFNKINHLNYLICFMRRMKWRVGKFHWYRQAVTLASVDFLWLENGNNVCFSLPYLIMYHLTFLVFHLISPSLPFEIKLSKTPPFILPLTFQCLLIAYWLKSWPSVFYHLIATNTSLYFSQTSLAGIDWSFWWHCLPCCPSKSCACLTAWVK